MPSTRRSTQPAPPAAAAAVLPTFTPRPWLEIDGVVRPGLHAAITDVRLHGALNQPARLQVSLALDSARSALGAASLQALWPLVAPGRGVEVAMDSGGQQRLFRGRIVATGLDQPSGQPPRLLLTAADGLQPLADAVRRRSLAAGTDASRVRAIATAHGLAAELDWPGASRPALVQLDESDLALLQRLARAAGRRVWTEVRSGGVTLCAGPVPMAPPGGLPTLVLGNTLRALQLWQDAAPGASAWRATAVADGALPALQPGHLVRVSPWPAAQLVDLAIVSITRLFDGNLGLRTELVLQSALN